MSWNYRAAAGHDLGVDERDALSVLLVQDHGRLVLRDEPEVEKILRHLVQVLRDQMRDVLDEPAVQFSI